MARYLPVTLLCLSFCLAGDLRAVAANAPNPPPRISPVNGIQPTGSSLLRNRASP